MKNSLRNIWDEQKEQIISTIEKIKCFDEHGDLTSFFTEGYCFYFAQILKTMFPKGSIFYNQKHGHFVFFYAGCLWDVTGEVFEEYTDETLIAWKELQRLDPLLASRIIRDCIKK